MNDGFACAARKPRADPLVALVPRGRIAVLDLLRAWGGGECEPRTGAPAASTPREERSRLRDAFTAFNLAAQCLERSYAELSGQVEQLTAELARANGELTRESAENRALAERQSALLAALPAGVVVVGACGKVREANALAQRLLGGTLIGVSWDAALARLERVGGAPAWLTAAPDRRRLTLDEQRLGVTGERIVVLHDITETHASHERLARSERLTAMGEMAARIAHQLRTPLATALLYASQLGRPELAPGERGRLTDKVLGRLRDLERVTRQMLRFVRGDTQTRTEIEVGSLIAEVSHVMAPLMASRGIAFITEDLSGGARLYADRRGLVAAVSSLLENAMQLTPQGGRVRFEALCNSTRLCIRVSDTGPGIPAESLPRLFEPFFSTRAEGTGLGLAIVKSVVEAHDGTVEVASAIGAGARFTLSLPRCDRMPALVRYAGDAVDTEVVREAA